MLQSPFLLICVQRFDLVLPQNPGHFLDKFSQSHSSSCRKHLSQLFHSVTYYFVESWGTRLTRGFVVANSEMNAAKKPPACMLISAVERYDDQLNVSHHRKCFDLEPVAAEEQQLPCYSEDDEELNPVFYLKEDEDMGEEELDDMAAKSNSDYKLVERSDQLVKDKVKDKTSDVPIEKVKKDFDSLSKDEKLQVVMSNAPELVGLLTELKEALHELEHKLEDGNFATREGKNYMEMKHMLLLSYCRTIVFYLLLRAEGRSVCDHPVIAKLVEIRTLLEKVRPIDKKLQQQIDKHMVLDTSKLPQQEDSAKDEVKPQFVGEESRNMLREMERLQEKARREQLLEQTRVSELQTGKRREAKRHRGLLDDLEDDLGALDQESQPKTISRVVAEAGKRQKKPKIISSDTDLPVKEYIGERRRKREVQTSGRAESPVEQSEDDDDGQTQREDEFYQEAKAIKLAKDAARMEKNRGLTPYRKKASKNLRKKFKMMHGKAVTRRKGQVRDIRMGAGPYGEESTGVRTNLSRSVRLS
ncbi:something about silencing protein 10 [Selaginella moellendorffii]|uniref:something about silencing protein 10 n=1 Tax=Selaginella moellendorffii TaxID=88036 RepID=UPI000D1C7439|nr:something about silencing protein 10 [Selaginella moellendorffii]|eukprot:XP_024532213.1 something about silencing protein 10 [Selaginella moellendorffii]